MFECNLKINEIDINEKTYIGWEDNIIFTLFLIKGIENHVIKLLANCYHDNNLQFKLESKLLKKIDDIEINRLKSKGFNPIICDTNNSYECFNSVYPELCNFGYLDYSNADELELEVRWNYLPSQV